MIQLFKNGFMSFLFCPPGMNRPVQEKTYRPVPVIIPVPVPELPPVNLKNSLFIGKHEGVNYYIQLDNFDSDGFRFVIIGQSGAGKSYFTRVMLEEFIDKGRRTIVIDPEGEWWSLKEAYKSKVTVIGGDNGISFGVDPDAEGYELNDKAIEIIGDIVGRKLEALLNSKGQSLVFDLSGFDDEDQQPIYALITGILFRLEKKYKKTVFLMVDEASLYAPQTEAANSKKSKVGKSLNTKKASKRNARRGRKIGIRQGYALQRPANFDKDVLANCTLRFIGRIEEEKDFEAVEHLLKPKQTGITFDTMKALKAGQFYVCHKDKVFLIQVRKCRTEHIGSTPEDDY